MASSAGSALSLIKAILDLVADRRTGVLDIRSDDHRTQIYFDDGKPLFAEDDAPGESFGRLLMRQGVITNDQFVRVIDERTRAAAGNSQLRFGEVAVSLGVLTNAQVEQGLAEQVCGIIARSLQRGESRWTFQLAPDAPRPPRAFSLEINPTVLAALQQSTDSAKVADVVAARPEELVVVAGPRPAPEAGVRDEAPSVGGGAETHAARIGAEQAFQKGLALLRDGKAASAAIELRRAADLQPESLEYLLYATWAKARSYREIPVDADQKALLDIAHRAKHRDPMLAFASYVLGQLSMWTGDEGTAKKWFYEALRLDPASEAGKQVRILARHAGVSMMAPLPTAPLKAEPAPAPAETAQAAAPAPAKRAPVPPPIPATALAPSPVIAPAPAPPAGTAAGSLPPKASAHLWAARIVVGAALVATAFAIVIIVKRSAPQAGIAPTAAAPQAPPSVEAAPAGDPERAQASAPVTKPLVAADKGEDDAKSDAQDKIGDDKMGTVVLPVRAAGHRIFVDGRRLKAQGNAQGSTEDGPVRLRCGPHVIQIGTSGSQEAINVPCHGEVQLQ